MSAIGRFASTDALKCFKLFKQGLQIKCLVSETVEDLPVLGVKTKVSNYCKNYHQIRKVRRQNLL